MGAGVFIWLVRLDEGNDVFVQIVLEGLSPTAEAATETVLASARGICRGIAVGEDDDHRFDFLVIDKIVEDQMSDTTLCPLFSLIGADAVEQIQHGILLVPGI